MMILRYTLLAALLILPACGPLLGGAVVMGADELVEEDRGGDGLF